MSDQLTFLFYHYGKIPKYLEYAVEQVRIFNPTAEIFFISDGIKDTTSIDRFDVRATLSADELIAVSACVYADEQGTALDAERYWALAPVDQTVQSGMLSEEYHLT